MSMDDPFAVIAGRIAPGAKIRSRHELAGGVSAFIHALELFLPDGSTRRIVVRRHGAADWKPLEADVAATEFALLKALHEAGMKVPAPLYLDTSREVFPAPWFVMEFVEGSPEIAAANLPDALRQMAETLARLHSLDFSSFEIVLPSREDPVAGALDFLPPTAEHAALRAALSAARPGVLRNAPVLLHGDFWPANILWKDDAIAAVVDWEDAARGDPLSDLAGCRVELLWAYGEKAMETFTGRYLRAMQIDVFDLPLWEIYVASAALAFMANWGLDPAVEADRRRKTKAFLERAARQYLSRHSPKMNEEPDVDHAE